jgi:LysM repeat protein
MNKLPAIAAAVALWLPSCGKKEETHTGPLHDAKLPTPELITKPGAGRHIEHVVKPGETLSKIGERYGVSHEAIAEYNHLKDPSLIRVGAVLNVPLAERTPEGKVVKTPPHSGERSIEQIPKAEMYARVAKGGSVPFLRLEYMPPEVSKHLDVVNRAVRSYAVKAELPLVGPALCGQGVCTAFEAIKQDLRNEGYGPAQVDAVFAEPGYYLLQHGSRSRDAFKIRETLEQLASMPESGWVRIAINDQPKVKGLIVRKHEEGAMYHPGNLPAGTIICYDPAPEHKAKGNGGIAWGHIEYLTKDAQGTPWYVHAINSEVHGGSAFCRKQFHEMRAGKGIRCFAFVLTTPETKANWLGTQLTAEGKVSRYATK